MTRRNPAEDTSPPLPESPGEPDAASGADGGEDDDEYESL